MKLLLICLGIGYLISGMATLIKEITAPIVHRSHFGYRPTFLFAVLVVFAWPILILVNRIPMYGQRRISSACLILIGIVFQTCAIGIPIWLVSLLIKAIFFPSRVL